jgi:hypothetical protein
VDVPSRTLYAAVQLLQQRKLRTTAGDDSGAVALDPPSALGLIQVLQRACARAQLLHTCSPATLTPCRRAGWRGAALR